MQVIDRLIAGLDLVEIQADGYFGLYQGSSPDKTIGWRTGIDGADCGGYKDWFHEGGCMPADTICT